MSPRLPSVSSKEIIRVLAKLGYVKLRQSGSHARFALPDGSRPVTIAVHSGKDIPPKTLQNILRQANLTADEFKNLL